MGGGEVPLLQSQRGSFSEAHPGGTGQGSGWEATRVLQEDRERGQEGIRTSLTPGLQQLRAVELNLTSGYGVGEM